MYGNYMGGPFMMPNVSYGPMLNPTMTRGASLGSGIRSLLGLGNHYTPTYSILFFFIFYYFFILRYITAKWNEP